MTKTSPSAHSRPHASSSSATRRQHVRAGNKVVRRNLNESPLTWLARRKGRDGRAMVDEVQLAAGERLRADFTRAGLTPQVTSRWSSMPGGGPGNGPEAFSDMVLSARQRMNAALGAVGPELSGVLLDVCCFLKGLEEVEGTRGWPARTAKVVLCLALDRLAAHYGWSAAATGRSQGRMQAWHAPAGEQPMDAAFPEDSQDH
ncbi:DUF6456 domain-containing protein [Xanthobacter sp. TB0136]|uniref:DUF6456 domain-containing protein n=1 Tax=Xanthobacter sp. TB0136 TaxID=3459177 RepID=UPI0040399F27